MYQINKPLCHLLNLENCLSKPLYHLLSLQGISAKFTFLNLPSYHFSLQNVPSQKTNKCQIEETKVGEGLSHKDTSHLPHVETASNLQADVSGQAETGIRNCHICATGKNMGGC